MDNNQKIFVNDQQYTLEEIEKNGNARILKVKRLLFWLGIGSFAVAFMGGILAFTETNNPLPIYQIVLYVVIFIVAGIILLLLSFRKRNPLEYGKKEIAKRIKKEEAKINKADVRYTSRKSSSSKYGLSDDPELDEMLYYEEIVDDD